MKKTAALILVIIVLFTANNSIAQKSFSGDTTVATLKTKPLKWHKNSLIFTGAYLYDKNNFFPVRSFFIWKSDMLGIYYQRKIWDNFNAKIGYNQYSYLPWRFSINRFMPQGEVFKAGGILFSGSYKMVDLQVGYTMIMLRKNVFNFSIGLSYTWGLNEVIDSVTHYPGYYDGLIFTHVEHSHYIGVLPAFSYDYLFCRNRFSMGFDIRYRSYSGFYVKAYEYGCHLALNF